MQERWKRSETLLAHYQIFLDDIAQLVFDLQLPYIPQITLEMCRESVRAVLAKREVFNAIMVGIELDEQAAQKTMKNKQLERIILEDEPLFGIDEVLGFGICNLYGSIALTNFGFLDKTKPGIIGKLNDKANGCHAFMDDLIGAIAASAASRFAHRNDNEREGE